MECIPLGGLERRSYFFDPGIRFACRQCGGCCVGEPGTIYVSPPEIETIAESLAIPLADFIAQYLYPFKDSYSIKEDHRGHCLFFDEGCTIYPIRPLQCRTYPFWYSNMRSEEQWERTRRQCPGIGHGERYSRSEILDMIVKSMPF